LVRIGDGVRVSEGSGWRSWGRKLPVVEFGREKVGGEFG